MAGRSEPARVGGLARIPPRISAEYKSPDLRLFEHEGYVEQKVIQRFKLLCHNQGTSWLLTQMKPNCASIAQKILDRQGFKTFLPLEDKTQERNGKFLTTTQPLFPGYLFVAFNAVQGHWRSVNSTHGVTRLVRFGRKTHGFFTFTDTLNVAVDAFKPDVIIHFAARTGVRCSLENRPARYSKIARLI